MSELEREELNGLGDIFGVNTDYSSNYVSNSSYDDSDIMEQ